MENTAQRLEWNDDDFEDLPPSYERTPDQNNGVGSTNLRDICRRANIRSSRKLKLEDIIEQNKVFKLCMRNTAKRGIRLVQIRGSDNNILMSTVRRLPNVFNCRNCSSSVNINSTTIKFVDTTGNYLLEVYESGDSKEVIGIGGQLYGIVDIVKSDKLFVYNSRVTGRNILGDLLFETKKNDSGSQVDFISSDGSIIIAVGENTETTEGNVFTVRFHSPVDSNTKILVITAARFMIGFSGQERAQYQQNLIGLIVGIVLLIVIFVVAILEKMQLIKNDFDSCSN